jgi:hypothetical protein
VSAGSVFRTSDGKVYVETEAGRRKLDHPVGQALLIYHRRLSLAVRRRDLIQRGIAFAALFVGFLLGILIRSIA